MERTEKGAASADVCVTKISPCQNGKGISYAYFLNVNLPFFAVMCRYRIFARRTGKV